MLSNALVVAQVVVHLCHDDEERGEGQAQAQQIQQVCCNKLLEYGCKVSDNCLHCRKFT